MTPEIHKVLNQVDQGRRDFLRKIIAGAAFAPPLLASFSLDGLSVAEAVNPIPPNMCVVSNTTMPFTSVCFDFSGTQYASNFTPVLRGADINPGLDLGGTGNTALNFTGSTGPSGSTWLTVLNGSPASTALFEISLSADVLIHRYNNSKGVGLLALAFSLQGDRGLGLVLNDAGNTDTLQLVTVSSTGQTTLLKSAFLGANIAENAWYRLEMVVARVFGQCSAGLGGPICPMHVTGEVFRHLDPSDPDSGLGAQIDGTLDFQGNLAFNTFAQFAGKVGLVGRAISTAIDSSVTNFCVSCTVDFGGPT